MRSYLKLQNVINDKRNKGKTVFGFQIFIVFLERK